MCVFFYCTGGSGELQFNKDLSYKAKTIKFRLTFTFLFKSFFVIELLLCFTVLRMSIISYSPKVAAFYILTKIKVTWEGNDYIFTILRPFGKIKLSGQDM